MGGQILKSLTVLKLLTTNSITLLTFTTLTANLYYGGGLCYGYGHMKMENYEKMEKEIYIYSSITSNIVL